MRSRLTSAYRAHFLFTTKKGARFSHMEVDNVAETTIADTTTDATGKVDAVANTTMATAAGKVGAIADASANTTATTDAAIADATGKVAVDTTATANTTATTDATGKVDAIADATANTTATTDAAGKVAVIPRNNTSFSLRLFEYFRTVKWSASYDFLKYYQNLVRMYVTSVESGTRGILASLEMGLGKSILAVSIAVDMLDTRQPIVLLTKSLQENMRGAVRKYVKLRRAADPEWPIGQLDDDGLNRWLDKHFRFVSMNASNMLAQMNRAAKRDEFVDALEKRLGEVASMASLDGKLLIVDEAHNLFRAITNGSKNAIGLYDMVMRARNLKIVFLTGTPIANDPFELAPCFNMLAGTPVLPESYREFNKLFVGDGLIKNKARFQNRLFGMVSHVSIKSKPGAAFNIPETSRPEFPEQLDLIIERVNMGDEQYVMYGLARDQELAEGNRSQGVYGGPSARPAPEPASMTKPQSGAASTYRVKSRQLGNWYGPDVPVEDIPVEALESPKFKRIADIFEAHPGELGFVYSQFTGRGGLGTLARYLESRGWKRYQPPDESALKSIKITVGDVVTRDEIGDDDGKDGGNDGKDGDGNVVDAGPSPPTVEEYLERLEHIIGGDEDDFATSTVDDPPMGFSVADMIADCDAGECLGGADPVKRAPVFALITGSVPTAVRQHIQDVCSHEDNKHGGIIDHLLLSAAAAEGLDLKNMRRGIITEPYWGFGREKQIFARGVRNDSHIALDPSERNFQPIVLIAVPPEIYRTGDTYPDTTDSELFYDSLRDQLGIDSFVEATHEIAIECLANDEEYCRKCSPTGMPLFTNDIARDIAAADPCVAAREEKIKAKSIVYDGIEYYFAPDTAALYDWRVYKRDADIDGYRAISDADPLLQKIVAMIEAAR